MYAENVWKTPIILESAWYLSKYSYLPYYSYPHLYYISMYGYYVYLPLQTYYFYPHLYNISTTSSLVKKFFTLLLYVCLIDVVTESWVHCVATWLLRVTIVAGLVTSVVARGNKWSKIKSFPVYYNCSNPILEFTEELKHNEKETFTIRIIF